MPAPQVAFKQGHPTMVDYRPTSAVASGDVIVRADTPCIAHRDIAANDLGALAAEGGIYEMTGDAAIAVDKKVYWNDTANKATETASGNKMIGISVSACAANDGKFLVRHDPAA